VKHIPEKKFWAWAHTSISKYDHFLEKGPTYVIDKAKSWEEAIEKLHHKFWKKVPQDL
jgi:hypothetical protein